MPESDSRTLPAVGLVYAAAALQGLAVVSVPALSTALKTSVGLDDAGYGALFLPQVACTVIAALCGGGLAARVGLKRLLAGALALNGISGVLLVAALSTGSGAGYSLLILATAALGLGFGLSAAPLNTYPGRLFPRVANRALAAVHAAIGCGFAFGPLLVAALLMTVGPAAPAALIGAANLVVAAAVALLPLPDAVPAHVAHGSGARHPLRSPGYWALASAAVFYAFAEGTFSNWIVIFLHEDRGLGLGVAGTALSVFWFALVAGRALTSLLAVRIRVEVLWLALPPLMLLAFLLLPQVGDARSAYATFALAGLACSGFFPLTVAVAAQRYPAQVAWVSSSLVAALMLGVGIGTFLIGPLRATLPLERLYLVSTLYPTAAFTLAALALMLHRAPRGSVEVSLSQAER